MGFIYDSEIYLDFGILIGNLGFIWDLGISYGILDLFRILGLGDLFDILGIHSHLGIIRDFAIYLGFGEIIRDFGTYFGFWGSI